MTTKPILLLSTLLVLWIGGGTWLYHQMACCSSAGIEEAYSSPFLIQDGGVRIANHPQNFVFAYADHPPVIPEQVAASFAKVAAYLKEHPDKSLLLTGHYRSDEANSTSFGSLGLARADTIKKYLIKLGLPATQIQMKDQLNEELVKLGKQIYAALTYRMLTKEKKVEEIKPSISRTQPLIIYFNKLKRKLILDEEQKAYFDGLVHYLKDNPSASVLVTGHTDAAGILKQNIRLGRKRAEFVKEYLEELGIQSQQIKTASKGPHEPIATNDTEEGKAINRRVEITIK